MRKRDLLRYVPGLSKVAQSLDACERHNTQLMRHNTQLMAEVQQLRDLLYQLLFANEMSLVEDKVPSSIDGEGDLPVPAGALRFLVAGTADLKWFLESGKLGVQTLVDVLARQGQTLDQFKKVLDFGCGCGRVLRHLRGVTRAAIHGSDANPTAIQWCARYLGFAEFRVNALEPPLPYPDRMFDLLYAFSVFTHLTEPLQARWMDELRRVLAPEGLLIVTVHGDKCAEGLPPADRVEYHKGNLVVREPDVVGTNYCNAYHPEGYVRSALARGLEVVDFIPEGAKGNPPQDVYLMRSRPNQALKMER
jgi:SAM-dependent methyltransferase